MSAKLPADIGRLRDWLTALHPGLYRYQTPAQFERRVAGLALEWQLRPALAARFLALSRFLAAIRCGHSFCNPNNQTDAIAADLLPGKRLLPLHFRWIGQRMVVVRDPWKVGVAPGSEVLAIDRVRTPRILAALLPYVRADGHNIAKQRSLLSIVGNDRFETFDIFHPLLFADQGDFFVTLRDPAGRVAGRRLTPIDRAARAAAQPPSLDRSGTAPWWTFEQRGPTAILTMDNWAVYQTKWAWQEWLQAKFAEMVAAGSKTLIVDLRGNEGGIDIGDHLIAHLIYRPLEPFRYRRLLRFRSVPQSLRAGLKTWDKSFFELGAGARPAEQGFLELTSAEDGPSAVLQPRTPRFAGKLIVLTDAANSSATNQFAARVQEKKLGTLVGGETGGNQRGINGGAFFFATLPESGLEFDLPLIATHPPRPMPDRGVVPDVPIAVTAADIAAGRDTVLEAAIRLAAKG
ncbi:S41 family peptidase [Sphingomonas mesophila]|uniref:S41 family peptidase n=1 Tax=Sphingomonas mesophila TaxID=2303576 RepID=UPI000E572137|nr:S41 family peptidase [Sphingomonas mesophila]